MGELVEDRLDGADNPQHLARLLEVTRNDLDNPTSDLNAEQLERRNMVPKLGRMCDAVVDAVASVEQRFAKDIEDETRARKMDMQVVFDLLEKEYMPVTVGAGEESEEMRPLGMHPVKECLRSILETCSESPMASPRIRCALPTVPEGNVKDGESSPP